MTFRVGIDNGTGKVGVNSAGVRVYVDNRNDIDKVLAQACKHLANQFTALSAQASRFASGLMVGSTG
ncbi:MAG: hypothetical protein OXB98_07425 [Bryobacterales bacterium]|nr:hypothetical protein [Bryobacterales bacterium]